MQKLRLVRIDVQPVVMSDDGKNLIELPIKPYSVGGADLDAFVEDLRSKLNVLEEQLNEPTA